MLTTSQYEIIQNLQIAAHTSPLTVNQSMTGVGQEGWVVYQIIRNEETGFDAVVYRNDTTHQYILAAEGRNEPTDRKNFFTSQEQDAIPDSYYDALATYNFLKPVADPLDIR